MILCETHTKSWLTLWVTLTFILHKTRSSCDNGPNDKITIHYFLVFKLHLINQKGWILNLDLAETISFSCDIIQLAIYTRWILFDSYVPTNHGRNECFSTLSYPTQIMFPCLSQELSLLSSITPFLWSKYDEHECAWDKAGTSQYHFRGPIKQKIPATELIILARTLVKGKVILSVLYYIISSHIIIYRKTNFHLMMSS
jgi:hypothetical protein